MREGGDGGGAVRVGLPLSIGGEVLGADVEGDAEAGGWVPHLHELLLHL